MKKGFVFIVFAGLLTSGLPSQDTTASTNYSFSKIKLSGYGYYMFGQLVSGVRTDEWAGSSTTINHVWMNTFLVHLNAISNVTDWFTTKLGFDLYADFPIIGGSAINKTYYSQQSRYNVYLASVAGIQHWDFQNPIINSLKFESGLVPYTINPQVKTLGNYLFRSTIHPPSVQNKMDYPWADLLGGIAGVGLFNNKVTFEAIIASEYIYVPLYDFTPAFTLNYQPNEVIDIGGAIAFNHAIQVSSASSAYITDSIGKKWQGTKLDFRAIFDPKPLFGGMPNIEKDQFKIYAELAFLGLEDRLEVDTNNLSELRTTDPDSAELKKLVFPPNSILHRMPFMIGINLPTWKIFDLLSIELEWFYSPYANDWFGKFSWGGISEARQPSWLSQWDNYINKDNFKWAINIRKSLYNFEIRSFFGSDHTIYKYVNQQIGNFEQTMKRPKDWHWFAELRYNL